MSRLADVGADLVGLVVEAVEREVDVAVVVGDADVGAEVVRHLVAANRVVRDPPIAGIASGARAHTCIVEHAVDLRRLRGSFDGEFVVALRTSDCGQQHTQQRQDANRFHHVPAVSLLGFRRVQNPLVPSACAADRLWHGDC